MDINIWDLSKPRIQARPTIAIEQLQKFAKTLQDGQVVTQSKYKKWNEKANYSPDSIKRLFGTWEEACTKAEVTYRENVKYSFDELFTHFEAVARWRGGRPSIDDMKEYNQGGHKTSIGIDAYARRWGGWSNFVTLYCQYKNGQILKEDLIKAGEKSHRRKAISAGTRAKVFARDGYKCVDCGKSTVEGVKLHVHHKKPVSKGG